MANISKTPDVYYQLRDGAIESTYSAPTALGLGRSASVNRAAGYRLDFPISAAVTACSLSVSLDMPSLVTPFTLRCSLYANAMPLDGNTPVATTTVQITQDEQVLAKTFSFSGLNVNADFLTFKIEYTANNWGMSIQSSVTATATYTLPSLTVSPSPATVYDMYSSTMSYTNTVTLTFGNRIGQLLHVQFKYNSTVVWDFNNIDEDRYSKGMYDFFADAGATGSSITVRVDVSDELGRTATASFTLIKPQGSTATPTAPKNTTLDGTLPINFAWTVSSGYGDQTMAELQYSTDNAAWTNLATINGSTKSWTAPKLTFPGGTIYWRVRVTNDFGVVGPWSSSVSFTARYDAVSQVYPVNSPTSGNFSRTADMQFQVGLETTGQTPTPFTIASAVFHWRAGTSGEWTDVAMTRASGNLIAYVVITGGTFPSGQMQWYAEATDNTGRTTETEVYTLTALVSIVDITPIRPINTVESGNGEIEFEFSFVSLDGKTPPRGEWEWSTDQQNWETLEFYLLEDWGDNLLTLTIPPDTFPAGTVYWRGRARNSAGVWGDWSETVSFKVLDSPTVDGVTGDGKPFLTITWQTPTGNDYGQQAYKIEVDGKLYGPYFGADVRSYTLKEPLEDGPHTVRVAAQNRFGLWSEWAEGNVIVTNRPGSVTFFSGAVAEGAAVHVIMFYAHPAPIITRQPQDYMADEGNAEFSFSYRTFSTGQKYFPSGPGVTVEWQYRTGPSAAWQEYQGPYSGASATPEASQAIDGYQYRVRLDTDVATIYSEPATFHYGSPAGPTSTLKEGDWKPETGYFLVYRDGVLIGKTFENEFWDYNSNGTHTYTVIQVIRNNYIVKGTPLEGYESATVSVDCPVICALGSGSFIQAGYTDDASQEITITRRRNVQRVYYSGAKYPAVEMSEHEELSASFPTFWVDGDDENADALETLVGKPVMLKTPKGRLLVGVLDSLPGAEASWRRAYTVTLTQMEWEDYRDES